MLAATLGALSWGILRDLALQWWDDPNYSHGLLVPIFSAWIAWRDRATVEAVSARGSVLGLVVLLGGIAVLLLGDLAAENFLMRSSLIIILAGLGLFLLGRETFRLLLFPLAFLFFILPLPAILLYSVTFPLQRFAAEQAAWLLDLLGVKLRRRTRLRQILPIRTCIRDNQNMLARVLCPLPAHPSDPFRKP